MKTGRLYYVKWEDARGVSTEWESIKKLRTRNLCVIESVGWLVKETKRWIVILPHVGSDPDQGVGEMTIPKGCIIRKVRIHKRSYLR